MIMPERVSAAPAQLRAVSSCPNNSWESSRFPTTFRLPRMCSVTAEVRVMTQQLARLYSTEPRQLSKMKPQRWRSYWKGDCSADQFSRTRAAMARMQKLGMDIRYSRKTELIFSSWSKMPDNYTYTKERVCQFSYYTSICSCSALTHIFVHLDFHLPKHMLRYGVTHIVNNLNLCDATVTTKIDH